MSALPIIASIIRKVLDWSPTNRERELGLAHVIGHFRAVVHTPLRSGAHAQVVVAGWVTHIPVAWAPNGWQRCI